MAETNVTTPTKKPASRARQSGGNQRRPQRPQRSTPTETGQTITLGQLLKMPQGEDNLIYQVQNYIFNRWCGAHQNSHAQPSGIELVAWAREKFGPRTMTVGGQAA